jgi:hypothetical protein
MMRNLLSLFAIALVACGGSVSGDDDGGSDASTAGDSPIGSDGSTPNEASTIDSPPSSPYDGTVGKACSTDADCHSANGPNVAKCSNSVFAPEDYYPTNVCIIPTCTTISDDTSLHFCDGPDDSSSPGICVPGFSGGVCLPKCTYDQNGGAPVGCAGKDTCNSYPTVKENGIGYCWAGCTQDQDCSDNQKCQVDQGLCVEGVTPPTKNFGAACTKSDTNAEVCNCLYGASNDGYCTSFCIVGSSTCGAGNTCDPFLYRAYGYSTSNAGMAGYCTVGCAGDASACPAGAACTNISASGPDCVPP